MPLPSPALQHKHRTTCGNQFSVDTRYLTCLHQAPPPRPNTHTHTSSGRIALLGHPCLSPRMAGPLLQKTSPNPHLHCMSRTLHPHCPTLGSLGSSSSERQQFSFQKQTRAHLVKTRHIQARHQIIREYDENLHAENGTT